MWVALDDEGTRDYLDGYMVPLDVRVTWHAMDNSHSHVIV